MYIALTSEKENPVASKEYGATMSASGIWATATQPPVVSSRICTVLPVYAAI